MASIVSATPPAIVMTSDVMESDASSSVGRDGFDGLMRKGEVHALVLFQVVLIEKGSFSLDIVTGLGKVKMKGLGVKLLVFYSHKQVME